MLLALVVLGAGLGLGRFAVPPALLGIRGLARLTRQLAGDWCGVPVPERYAPPPAGRLTYTGRLRWLVTDPATWRDLLWIAANLVVCVPAALSAAIIATGLIEFIGPELTRENHRGRGQRGRPAGRGDRLGLRPSDDDNRRVLAVLAYLGG